VEQNKPVENKTGEAIVRANQYLVKKDAGLIQSYAARRNWKMIQTGTGLRYINFTNLKTLKVNNRNKVTLTYRLELLDGTLCYTSDSLGLKTFSVGSGQVESGLDEGVALLAKGDSACFIIPPHLAYGLIGDEKRVPPRSTLVYHVKLINISN